MTGPALDMLMASGPEETTIRFQSMPALWLVIMVIVPAVVLVVWWTYRREADTATPKAKRLMAVLRILAIVFVILLLFHPFAETSVKKLVKSHLVVLLDTSASMGFADAYSNPMTAEATRKAAGLGEEKPSAKSRLELVKGLLANTEIGLIDRLTEKFHLHLYTFDSDTGILASAGDGWTDEEARKSVNSRISELRGTGAYTFIGDAVSDILDEFRLRDEPLAAIVAFTDGRQNGGETGPIDAARKAASAQPPVPLYMVGVGDPDLPRNIHVANLRAREVVLRGEEVRFEFDVSQTGYSGEPVTVTLEVLDARGAPEYELDLRGADVVLGEEDEEKVVRVFHRFERPGSYSLRIGIPVEPGEKIDSDNFLYHPSFRVVDKKIKVLYVEGYPRWEYRYLKDALIRDTETILAHVVNLDASSDVVQPYSAGWEPRQYVPTTREELFEYDVIIFGDVDWERLVPDSVPDHKAKSKEILGHIREFVQEGGGFIMIAGPYDSPRSYQATDLRYVLPVVLSDDESFRIGGDTGRSFNMVLTDKGRIHPIMMLEDDPEVAAQIWERDKFSAQFWYYPVARAKSPADVLAVHPATELSNRNDFGPHVLVATMPYNAGRSLFIAVDELWRLRWAFGDRYHYRFYGEAIRLLATYKLLGGNKRFKIFTDREKYFIGDTVTVTAEVYDHEFRPATEETQTVRIRTPDGEERNLELTLDSAEPGRYVHTLSVYREGTFKLSADAPDGEDEKPERLFKVQYSTEEMKNPLIDVETMQEMAKESAGEALPLHEAGTLPGTVPPKSVFVSAEVRSEDLWDSPWVLIIFTLILAAEWLVRKRYRLI